MPEPIPEPRRTGGLTGADVAVLAPAGAACGSTVPQLSQVSRNQSLSTDELGQVAVGTGTGGTTGAGSTTTGGSPAGSG